MMIRMRAWQRQVAVGIAVLGWLACIACGSDDGGGEPDAESASKSGASAQALECSLPDDGYSVACNECLASQCCAPIGACLSDAATCAQQLGCVVRCQAALDATACYDACGATDPGYIAYEDCSFDRCLSTCWM
jgi:hypothetical protein